MSLTGYGKNMNDDELIKERTRGIFDAIESANEAHCKVGAIDGVYLNCLFPGSDKVKEITMDVLEIKRQIWRLKQKLEQL
jgi:hypothetical protein